MKRQKRIALVNDVTGFGRCSVAVELPLISALKVQACPLPTAILSCHTGFPTHFIDDYTSRMRPYMEDWQQNGVQFDGICTGFLGSAEQIAIVADFIRMFKQPGTRVMVDPVMGDYGKLYSSYTQEMCDGMKRLLALADIVTPNLTEACRLLDRPYPAGGRVEAAELEYMAAELAAQGPSQVVITGLSEGEMIENFVYEAGRGTLLKEKKVGGDRSGSGDAFAAIVAASLVRGASLTDAVKKAADFISKCLAYAVALDLPWNYGLPFEEYLTELR
ncbi:MAG: pyridoxamine kinase [Selenomonadaceae bacterium]|uniref:pyridoxal kinase n=1 Tax=Selenomonas bovis TaxID=416586 RepID=A0A848B791_9FIRM|nr:pyridoxamine kinase [Selenomonas bovis]MDY6272142.1 pyridoxamine kinase [Selenomonadaceae bacterium]MCI6753180.1 pyridoxamine kinase [Selenomonas bovis]MCI7055967.1 pyridoxamine kinase [Selenomonas bovis]MDY6300250.1 pyridoxamine kinase [Selenomonadaceae bacterium]NMD99068.1 pyridoxamine kinase [Selenomonas bovis]